MCQNLRPMAPDGTKNAVEAPKSGISRRRLLGGAAALGVPAAIGLNGLVNGNGGATPALATAGEAATESPLKGHEHGGFIHAGFAPDRVVDHDRNGFNPTEILRDFDWGKTRRLPGGRVLRE